MALAGRVALPQTTMSKKCMSNDSQDRCLGMGRGITRRDFLNGVAVAVGTSMLAKEEVWAGVEPVQSVGEKQGEYYPPALTGMRGNHDASFTFAHRLRDGEGWDAEDKPESTGESYDLVVVGGGISGLAAAYFYRKSAGENARILILDNHDDFGGHAKRNEFHAGGRLLLANGGTWAIESPFPYSKVARGLMDELGIDPAALARKCYRPEVYRGLGSAVFFDRETFGADRLAAALP